MTLFNNYNFTWFCREVTEQLPDGGTLKIVAMNNSEISERYICPLDNIIQIQTAENIAYDYDENTLNITDVHWNTVPDADLYKVRFYIYDSASERYIELYDCRSGVFTTPDYTLPTVGLCNVNAYGDFIIRILSQNYDFCELKDTDNMENRSSTWWVSPTVIIGDCHSGVYDQILSGTGYTMSEFIDECAAGATNHGDFVKCISKQTNEWKSSGLISGEEKGAIQACAANADIP
jgi:hypothetical protein